MNKPQNQSVSQIVSTFPINQKSLEHDHGEGCCGVGRSPEQALAWQLRLIASRNRDLEVRRLDELSWRAEHPEFYVSGGVR